MAWVLDAANTGVNENDADSTVTFSHTCGTLTGGILFVWVAWATTASTITGITYGGVSMTQAVHQPSNRACDIWYLINPPSGANNVVISGSGTLGRISTGSHSWSGANATQTPTTITGNGTSANPSLTVTTATGELIVDCLGISFTAGETLTPDANQTERGNVSGGATRGASSTQDGANGGVMSWTDSASKSYGYCAASFAPAAATQVPAIPVKVINQSVNRSAVI